jgi:hypothetical protein
MTRRTDHAPGTAPVASFVLVAGPHESPVPAALRLTADLAGCPDSSEAAPRGGQTRTPAVLPPVPGVSRPAVEPPSSGLQTPGPLPEEVSASEEPCIGLAQILNARSVQIWRESKLAVGRLGGPVLTYVRPRPSAVGHRRDPDLG